MIFPSDSVNELLSEASVSVQPTVMAAAHGYLKHKKGSQRISILEVFNVMMTVFGIYIQFCFCIFALLLTKINHERKGGRDGGNYSLPPIPNGVISPSMRLGAAIQYFSGGSPFDIMCVFGVSYSEVLSSVDCC